MSSKESTITDKKEQETNNLLDFRIESFTKLLGSDWPLDDITRLVDSDHQVADLRNLLDNGCSKELAVRILL